MKHNHLEIVTHTGKLLAEIDLNSVDWETIKYVDYIAVDYNGQVIPEFRYAYGYEAYENMQSLVNQHINN